MIPVRLRLRNFLCYHDNVDPLDFTSIHLACLAGENGHGKSALLDAITWAVWGKARASTDELIYSGETEMEVEFEFLLEGNRYRVLRKRDKRRSQTWLELTTEIDGKVHILTESNIRATQNKIDALLHMDYETFINSAFLVQGRADEFTTKTPIERKRILAEILGLTIYDEYEKRAKELAKDKEAEAKAISAQIDEWEREINQRASYERDLTLAEERAQTSERLVKAAQQIVEELNREQSLLESKRSQRDAEKQREKRLQEDLKTLDDKLAESKRRIAESEEVLAKREVIEAEYAKLLAARKQLDGLSAQMQEYRYLEKAKDELARQLDAKRQEFVTEEKRLQECLSTSKQKAANKDQIDNELQNLERELAYLTETEVRRDKARENLTQCGQEMARWREKEASLRAEVDLLCEKKALLSSVEAQCPLCGSSLSESDRLRLRTDFTHQIAERQRDLESVAARISELDSQVTALRQVIDQAEKELQRLPELRTRKGKLEAALEEARRASNECITLDHQLAELHEVLARNDWLPEVRVELKKVETQLAALGDVPGQWQNVQAKITQLAPYQKEHERLLTAETNFTKERERLADLEERHDQIDHDLKQVQDSIQTLDRELERWDECIAQLEEAKRKLDQARKEASDAGQQVGAAREKLASCQKLEEMRKVKIEERTKLLAEQELYEELRVAFGKNGLQAMIIEDALPEIEDEANAILFRMTDGPMRVRLETQREKKDKEIAETLEITVSDQWGSRAYELFSGGEAFRINFALRVALSKLLARRAGASLQTLIIDEGFGTQDAQGRERLIEAINSIQNDFEKVLVITHIEELREQFPNRIDVFKTAYGSQFRVS